jgi:hypothetical protein
MTIQPDQICFGLSEQLDKESFSCFLQLAGNKEFADVLAARLTSEEIGDFVSQFMALLRRYLSEEEYHRLFLQDKDPHKH